MTYWWVNQGQTWLHEIHGNYLWAPRVNNKGQTWVGWTNMLKLRLGDIVFSHTKRAIRAVGIVTGQAVESPRPDFGLANSMWENDGWEALVAWEILPEPINPRDYLELLNEHRQSRHMPMNPDGKVNLQYLFELPAVFGQALASGVSGVDMRHLGQDESNDAVAVLIQEAQAIVSDTARTRTERQQLVAARLGQGIFKSNVAKIEPVCRVTGVAERRHLIASHIKPWRDSDNFERMAGANGLLLSPHVDHLFDRGLITFRDSGTLVVSAELSQDVVTRWSLNAPQVLKPFRKNQSEFLDYHRDVIFKQGLSA